MDQPLLAQPFTPAELAVGAYIAGVLWGLSAAGLLLLAWWAMFPHATV